MAAAGCTGQVIVPREVSKVLVALLPLLWLLLGEVRQTVQAANCAAD